MKNIKTRLRSGLLMLAGAIVTLQPATAAEPLRVQYYGGILHEETLYNAVAEGLFEKNGLDVKLVSMNSGPAALAALASDSVDVIVGNPDIMITGLQGGFDLQALCAGSGVFWQLVAKPEIPALPYPNIMKAFDGKRLGVTAAGASGQFFGEALLEGAGMPRDAVQYIGVGTLTAVEAMQNDRIDAYMSFEPVTAMVTNTTDARVILNMGAGEGPPTLTNLGISLIWFTKHDNLEARPAAYEAFVRSLQQAQEFAADPANRDKVVDNIIEIANVNTKNLPGGDETLRGVLNEQFLGIHNVSKLTHAEMTAWMTYMQQYVKKTLKGDYATKDPAELMQGKIWEKGCQ